MKKIKKIIIVEQCEAHTFRDVDRAIYNPWSRTLKVFSHTLGAKCIEIVTVPEGAVIRAVNCRVNMI